MNTLYPGIDGMAPKGVYAPDGCCPPDICSVSVESIACSMINLLPSGPLWDKAKEEGISCNQDWCNPVCKTNDNCTSLVRYAVYTGRRLHSLILDTLWPALRESNPATAWDTMDEWLDRLGWRDCYNSLCRDPTLGQQTPYEIMGECGVEYCPPEFPSDFSRLYKRGVILALWRLRHGSARNLAAINFIIKDLFAELIVDPENNPNNPDTPVCLVLKPTTDFANKIIKRSCPPTDGELAQESLLIQTYLTPGHGVCIGSPSKVYPMQLAAHCIVRSLLPTCNNFCIKRIP